MGLEYEEDAFLATKQAVYCLLYDRNPNTFYISSNDIERGGSDERGDKIKNAIVNIVDKARNGCDVYTRGSFEINKTNAQEDELDKNYISSIYTVSSKFNLKKFTVIIQDETPDGTLITDINNVEKSEFDGGESFKILIPKTSLTNIWNSNGITWSSNNINFNINVQAELKTYPILYGQSTIPGTQNYVLTGIAFETEESNTNFEYITNGGDINVVKTSDDYNYWTEQEKNTVLSNAKYELTRADTGKIIKVLETDSNGRFNISGLPKGEYILEEIEAPNYYKKDENIYNFKITEENQIINLKLTNSPVICGFFNIEKTSSGYSLITKKEDNSKLQGAKYEIRDKNGNYIYTGTTNDNGEFNLDLKLEKGEYIIFETEAPEGYVLDKNIYNFTISEKNGEKVVLKLKNAVIEYKEEKQEQEKEEKIITTPKLPKTGF